MPMPTLAVCPVLLWAPIMACPILCVWPMGPFTFYGSNETRLGRRFLVFFFFFFFFF